MTSRRRNLLILLFVAGLLAASAVVVTSQETRLGLDLRGGVELVYEASPTPQAPELTPESLDRAIAVMRDRVDQLGVAEPELQRTGETQISVALPDVDNAERAQQQVGRVAQLYFYDWEPNVIGEDGEPAPQDPEVTGGAAAGRVGGIALYDAVLRAKGRDVQPDANATREGSVWYAVNRDERCVAAGPLDTERDALEVAAEDERNVALPDEPCPGADTTYEIKEGTSIVRAEQPDDTELLSDQWFVLNDDVALRGSDIRNPEQAFDQGAGGSGQPIVTFEFTQEGRDIWQEVTREIAQRGLESFGPGTNPQDANQHFAIVLDNELVSVPFIDFNRNPDGIDGRTGSQIEGGFTIESSQELANLLRTGALPVRLELVSQSQVSATLGAQALDQGLVAGLAGFAIVVLFLVGFYRFLGVIAVAGLLLYAAYFFALIKLIPVVLTLPGIAGLVLTLGVAADANIVIFERIKEEIRAGRSITAGIATGYKKGLTAIIDANVVIVGVAFILFVLATAGVQGFALVLGLGTLVSLFTAVLATQAILGTMSRTRILARPSALGAGKPKRAITFDFMGASRWFFSASGVLLLVGALAIGASGLTFGIDFESGTRISAAFERDVSTAQVREVLGDAGLSTTEAKIQEVSSEGDDAEGPAAASEFQISTGQLAPDEVTGITGALTDAFGQARPPDTQSIGPTFGASVADAALKAIILSFLVIAAYISVRFQPKYAVPVLIAIMHDVLLTAGVYSLTGREVTTATVAALLTILGYSLYDTIIVFDRIRENVPRLPRATFSQVTNRSMSEVLVRSLATTVSTLLPVLCLFLFGGETLRDFAFALMVGIVSGTYSSIFIATPVLVAWKEREPVYARRRAALEREHGGTVPAYPVTVATVGADAPVAERRARPRPTAPGDPARGVSREEFDAMVADLGIEETGRRTAIAEREEDTGADARVEDVRMPGEDVPKKRERSKRPRNRRHGRPR